jgi:pilus assembly protein CpaB
MRNKRLIIALVGALFFGLLAAVSVSRYISNARAYTNNLTGVVVAKVDIPLGSKIIAEQLTTVRFPREAVPEGAFSTMDKLVGRYTVVNVLSKEPIVESRLAPEGSTGGLSAIIPAGYRAMTVKVDEVVGVSGFLMPGALVDIVVVIENPGKNATDDKMFSKIVLQNIKVLANGQNLDKPSDSREANKVTAVTLQVTPDQAEKLALASTEGKLRLVMRNSVDQDDMQTTGADKKKLLTGESAIVQPDATTKPSEVKPNRRGTRRISFKMIQMPSISQPATFTPQIIRHPSVEVIEGVKKKTVEFP